MFAKPGARAAQREIREGIGGLGSRQSPSAVKKGVAAALALGSLTVAAQDSAPPYASYASRVKGVDQVSPLSSDVFGENVNLYDGSTEFSVVDIDLPGNNALPVQLRRTLRVQPAPNDTFIAPLGGLADWDIDIPHISATFDTAYIWPTSQCSNPVVPSVSNGFSTPEFYTGMSVHIPGQGDKPLFRTTGESGNPALLFAGGAPWTTKDYDVFTCTSLANPQSPLTGEGFVMKTADGNQYTFNVGALREAGKVRIGSGSNQTKSKAKVYFLVSEIKDRYGNTVTYSYVPNSSTGVYANGKLASIVASDGRSISLNANRSNGSTATAHGRTWTYIYSPFPTTPSLVLSTVTLPDGISTWRYAHVQDTKMDFGVWDAGVTCSNQPVGPEGSYGLEITHPAGAKGIFSFEMKRHYRRGVSLVECGTFNGQQRLSRPYYFDVLSLTEKSIIGAGIVADDGSPTQYKWNYDYGIAAYNLESCGASCSPGTKKVTVSKTDGIRNPDNTLRVDSDEYEFGIIYAVNANRLLSTQNKRNGVVARTTINTYMTDTDASSQTGFQPIHYGSEFSFDDPSVNQIRPIVSTVIAQDGATFSTQWPFDKFDNFARPTEVVKTSSVIPYPIASAPVRTDVTAYHDNTAEWILGQVATVTSGGKTVVSNTYRPTYSDLHTVTRFGKLQYTLDYYGASDPARGALRSVTDEAGNTATLGPIYKRGIPEKISYNTSPAHQFEAATVSDFGELLTHTSASVVGIPGATTTYGYDAIGRLTSVAFDGTDSVAWNARSRQFTLLDTTFTHGLQGKRWMLTESTGQARKETYFDALMRPVITRSYVNGPSESNLSVELRRFDSGNRTTYNSYPQGGDLSVTMPALPDGVRSGYDVLGRATSARANSELGELLTLTQYGSPSAPFVQQVTSPKSQITKTWFNVMGSPDEAKPSLILAPENVTTRIERDLFDKPVSIVRSGIWESSPQSASRGYVYDEHERLCRTNQPETGSTIVNYDLAGNVAWSASGLNIKSLGCQRSAVPEAKKVSYLYDGRNRLHTTRFDGQDKIVRTLKPNGAVESVASDGTVWSYGYNKRGLLEWEHLTVDNAARSFALDWGYDSNGNLSSLEYPDGELVAFNPSALGKPTKVGSYATGITTYPNGAFHGFTYGNGITHEMIPNERGLPEFSIDAGVLSDGYTYDPNGNVSRIDDNRPTGNTTRVMTYDDLDRLVSTSAPGLWGTAIYSYDALDNLRTAQVGSRSHVHAISSTSNRLTGLQNVYGTTLIGYEYDDQGNVAKRDTQLFEFDKINRLRVATGQGEYRYDGWGRRVVIDESGGALRYQVYSQAGQLLHEVDGVTEKTTNYLFLGSSLVARKEIEIRDVPDAPVLSVAPTTSPNTAGVYTVSWTVVAEAVRYVLKERVNGSAPTVSFNGSGNAQPFGGKPTGNYTYTVQACSGSAPETCGTPSAPLTVSVLINPICTPTAPVDSTNVNPDVDGSYTLKWTCSGGDDTKIRYTLEESLTGTTGWTQVVAALEGASRDISDKPTGTYYYRAKACLSKAATTCGAWSPVGSESVLRGTPLPPPTGFNAVVVGSTITLSWNANGSAAYKLEEDLGSNNWQPRQENAQTSLAISGRANGDYLFRVRSCAAPTNCGAPTPELAVRVEVEDVPGRPQPPTVAPETCNPWPYCTNTTGSFTVSWAGVSGATSYKLFEDPPGPTGPTEVPGVSGTSKAFTNKPNGEYVYTVQACNAGCSVSSFGKRIEVAMPPGLVTGLTATPPTSTNGAYTLSWNAVATATSYVLSESVDAGGNPISLPAVTTTSMAFTGKGNGTYRYYVKACAYETCGEWNTTPVYVTVNQASAPTTPTGLHGPPPPLEGPVDYEIAWTAVSGAASYKIEEFRSCNPNPIVHVSTSADHLVGWGNCSPAGNGQTLTFNFRVKACNALDQCSPYSPQIQLTFTVEGGGVERPQPITSKFYVHTDALGSVVAVTDVDKQETERRSYEPYGGPSLESSFTDGPGYTGHVADERTGMIYMQQRYYDPLSARFLSPDPASVLEEPFALFNRYSYAGNSPYNSTDPDGRVCVFILNHWSPYCQRRDIYRQMDERLGGSTRFFGAASQTVEFLANSDMLAAKVAGRLGAGVSPEAAQFLREVSSKLFMLNLNVYADALKASISGDRLDKKLVSIEQAEVQKQIDSLAPEQREAIIGSINSAFANRATIRTGSSTDAAYTRTLDKVEKSLGRAIDFGKQGDREAIGKALIRELRASGACSATGTRIKSC